MVLVYTDWIKSDSILIMIKKYYELVLIGF